jgi:hypothetical protein
LLFLFIRSFGVNVVYMDEWLMVPLLSKFESGTLTFQDLFALHNEHRIFFPKLAMLGLAELTRYNTVAEMLFSWVMLCLTALIIFYCYWKSFPGLGKTSRLLTLVPVSLLLFGFQQWEAILWGFTLCFYLTVFGVVAALAALYFSYTLDRWFAAGIFAAVLASYSTAIGPAVWLVGPLLIVTQRERHVRSKLAVWCATGTVAWAIYLNGWVHPSYHPSLFYSLQNPISATMYFIVLLASPINLGPLPIALVLGLVLASIAVLLLGRTLRLRMVKRNGLWISLIMFVALASAATTIGRAGFGVQEALSSRYTPVASIGIAGVYLLSSSSLCTTRIWRKNVIHCLLLALIFLGVITSYGTGWTEAAKAQQFMRMSAYVLRTYQYQSDANTQTYLLPAPYSVVAQWAKYLQQKQFSVFATAQENASCLLTNASLTLFWVDTIAVNGSTVAHYSAESLETIRIVSRNETFTIGGWAFDRASDRPATAVFLSINGITTIPVLYGLERQDVGHYFGTTNLIYTGWIATFSTSVFAKGTSSVHLEIVSSDGIQCSTQSIFSVVST